MAQKTTDHERIKAWAELRGGRPAAGEEGLHIDFVGEEKPLSWDEFFQKFDQQGMVLVYEERTPSGQLSKFCQIKGAA